MRLAKQMIDEALKSGASLVKSQLYDAEDDKGKPQYPFSKQSELSFNQAKELYDYGQAVGIEVFYSVFGLKYVDWCERIGVKRYKIACKYRDREVLDAIRTTRKPCFISVNSETVTSAPQQWDWLWCIPDYPAVARNFKVIPFNRYKGFSDHTIGIDTAKIALARGARVIEKHFTLDKTLPGPDQFLSIEPNEMRELTKWEVMCKEIL